MVENHNNGTLALGRILNRESYRLLKGRQEKSLSVYKVNKARKTVLG